MSSFLSSRVIRLVDSKALVVFLFCLSAIFCTIQSSGQGTWSTLTHLAPHANSGVMLVLTDGTIMCKTSSGSSNGTVWDKLTPDIHGSYKNGTWTSVAAMHDDRLYFSSQVLSDGRVYVAGGEYGTGLTKGETYNPQTNIWTAAPVAGLNISDANSQLLASGKVLQAAVASDLRHTFIFDPVANSYAAGPSTLGIHNESVWVKLPDGSVLFIDRLTTLSERYIPATNTWIRDANVPVGLYDPYGDEAGAGFLLPNGNVFFIGSPGTTAIYTPSGTTSPGTWTTGPVFPGAPQGAPDAPAAMMVNGKILCVVSPIPTSGDHFPDSSTFYEYDYAANNFTLINTPFGGTLASGLPTFIQNMVCLPDGNILYSYQGNTQYYIYTPGSAPLAAGKPAITNVLRPGCDTFTAVGTLFNGITEGAAYGDDWQMSSNYPLVRLTSGTNVYYARTYHWNRLGAVMTGALPDTVQFILPPSLPVGTYTLQVIANGNASDGVSFSTCGTSCTAPPISGTSNVCLGGTTTLSDATTGGTWTSSNTTVASVDPTSGVVTGRAGGTATITYTASGCTATLIVTVNPISPITGASSVCAGSSVSLADATTGGTWSTSSSAVATISAGGVVTGIAPGTANIIYTTAAGCTAVIVFTVNSSASPISGSVPVCQGSSITLSDVTSGGTWISGNTTVATVDASAGTVRAVSPGTATITYTVSGGCSATSVVTVNGLSAGITGASTVCAGLSIPLADVTGGGIWSSSSTDIATVNSSGTVGGVSQGTATISYTVTNGCGTNTVTQVVTVSAAPTAGTITGTAIICTGTSTLLSDAATGGVWSSSNTGVATVDISGSVTGVTAGTASIVYTVTGSCGLAVASMTVTVNGNPVIGSITGTGTVCAGGNTLLADATTGGVWNSGNAAVAGVNSSGLVNGVAAGTAIISYTVTNGCGSTTATDVITVSNAPTAGTITGTANVCVAGTITLADAATGGVWSSSNTGVASVSAGAVRGIAAGTATISYSVTNSCGTAIATQVVTVNAAPSAGTITGTATVCSAGATTTLSDATTGGVWSSSNTLIASINTSGVVTGGSAGTSTISYTVTGACGTAVATDVVTVSAAPVAGTITGTKTLCAGATTTLSDATTGGVWHSSNTAVASVSTTGVTRGIASGTATISYTVTGSCGAATATAVVTVNAAPAAGTITGTATVCVSATTTLSDATTGGVWSSSNTAKASVSSAGAVRGVAAGTATISYTVSNSCGSATATKIVTVNAAPAAGTISGTASVCAGSTTTLSDATTGGVWHSSNTAKASVSTTGAVRGIASGTATISYTVTNSCGSAVATKVVTVNTTPTAGTISGSTSVAVGATITLTDATPGGVWSSSNTSKASVNASGVVRGVATGSATISYSVTNSCSTARATKRVTVTAHKDAPDNTTGTTEITPEKNIQVFPNPTSGTFTVTAANAGVLYLFSLDGKEVGRYEVKEPTSSFRVPNMLSAGVYVYKFIDVAGITASGQLVYKP